MCERIASEGIPDLEAMLQKCAKSLTYIPDNTTRQFNLSELIMKALSGNYVF